MPKLLSVLFVAVNLFITNSFAQISLHQESAIVPQQVDGSMALLYDQTAGGNANGYTSQDFEASLDTYDSQIADDFVVPAPGWTIDQVVVSGQYNTGGPALGFNVYFYTNSGGMPGAQVYYGASQSFIFNGTDLFTITLASPPVLTPGTYWVSVQCRMDYNVGGQWYWNQINGTVDSVAQWQNPGGGFGTSCSSWSNIQTCISAIGTDQYFALYGLPVVEVETDVPAPAVFALDQNHPNPFNPSTMISFKLAVDSKVSLKIFNVLGQEVANLLNGNLAAGSHQVNFDASLLNTGVYMYRIEAAGVDGSNFVDVKKMILTK